MREANKLSAVKVAKLKTPGRYGDGLGLWLQVSQFGTKAWLFRYTRHGRARQMGLGPLHTSRWQKPESERGKRVKFCSPATTH
jgi:hypothetical protein